MAHLVALLSAVASAVQVDLQDSRLSQEDEIVASKTEVGDTPGHIDLAYEVSTGSPYVEAVTTAAVDIAVSIQLHPVWDACGIGVATTKIPSE